MIPYNLTIKSEGVTVTRGLETVPNLGAIIPAKQTVALSVEVTLAGLKQACITQLPLGFSVVAGEAIYAWDGAMWQDDVNGGPVADTILLQGEYFVRNPASYDIGITW